MARTREALERKDEMLEACSKRNKSIEELAAKAGRAFEKAAKEQEKSWREACAAYEKYAEAWKRSLLDLQSKMKALRVEAEASGEAGLIKRIELAMRSMALPPFASSEGETKFDPESGILIHEHRFPDPSGAEWIKHVQLKDGWTPKPANQKEKKEAAAKLHPSLCLRLAAEIARLDDEGIVKAVAVNGWAEYTEKSTGQRKRAYCASLFATKEQIMRLNLSALDPLEAFSALKGISARSLELAPIAPIVRLDTNDPRFVDAKEVLSKMAEGENLAAMDWEDFEHLCRELFERAFASAGAEVKVTQASRDQGVDAVVFDPDPLRGGKIVIQAKRYTNTVDVSAVRDLYGAVINEGAVKGILVTTSHFGPESYSFAKDKPLTLLNGHELLGLLEQHGYKFRINLAEAKGMLG
jgi:restriction system protein